MTDNKGGHLSFGNNGSHGHGFARAGGAEQGLVGEAGF